MCNAWNHPSGCTCGFGGEGHLGRREPYRWIPAIVDSYESYVNPNASCPVCGALVFYYRSPEGGSVFFDELGPPWPKHPCTDRSSLPRAISGYAADRLRQPQRQYAWQREGWEPFVLLEVIGVDNYVLKLLGKHKGSQLTLYMKRIVHPHSGKNPMEPTCLASLRQGRNGNRDISMVTTTNRVIQAQVYDSHWKANDAIQKLNRQSAGLRQKRKKSVRLLARQLGRARRDDVKEGDKRTNDTFESTTLSVLDDFTVEKLRVLRDKMRLGKEEKRANAHNVTSRRGPTNPAAAPRNGEDAAQDHEKRRR